MSRDIDFSEPLDADDEQYVKDRPWMLQDAELQGIEVRYESEEEWLVDDEFQTSDENPEGVTGTEGNDDETVDDETGTEDVAGAGTYDDETDDDETDEGGEGDESTDEVAPYAEWDYADLKAEAGTRGLKQNGSKEQLIERLEENDASAPE